MVILATHNNKKILIEDRKIELAKIPAELIYPSESEIRHILVHPRYSAAKSNSQIIEVWGRLVGRTAYVLSDELIQGADICNFKGVGATDAMGELIISPENSVKNGLRVVRETIQQRVWGGVTQREGMAELKVAVDSLAFVSNYSVNSFPKEINDIIYRRKIKETERLGQLVRLVPSTVRFCDLLRVDPRIFESLVSIAQLGKADFELLDGQKRLAHVNDQAIYFEGDIVGNRYIDGTFTDSENIHFRRLYGNMKNAHKFAFEVVLETLKFMATETRQISYLEALETHLDIRLLQIVQRNNWEEAVKKIEQRIQEYFIANG